MRTLEEKATAGVTFDERLAARLLELESAIGDGGVYLSAMYRIATKDRALGCVKRAAFLIQYAHLISTINDDNGVCGEGYLESSQLLTAAQEVIQMLGFVSTYQLGSNTSTVAAWATGIAVMLYNS